MAGAKWKEQKDRETQENTGILSKLRQDLLSAGVKESTLPTRADLKKKGEQMGLLLASSPWPELKDQAKVSTPSVKLAEEFLSLFPQPSDGLTTDLVKEVLVNREKRIDDLRKVAQTRREEKGERVPRGLSEAAAQAEFDKARKELARTEPEEGDGDDDGEGESEVVTEAEARRKLGTKPISQLREDAGITDPSENHTKKALIEMLIADGIRAGVIATGAEPAKKARRPATPRQEAVSQDLREALRGSRPAPTSAPTVPSPSPRGQRLAGYEDKRASTRRSDVKPSERVLAEAKSDVLLFTLNDGSTQVWAKGALTETFVSSRQGASWQIATRYVKNWITLKPKSRLNCRILFTAEDEPDLLEVILESAAARRTATGAAKKVPREQVLAASREEALRKNPRNPRFYPNPRSSRNRAIASEIRAEFRRNGLGERSNPAADLPGRYDALRRMAAPGSGASANERRVALMQMEKIRKQLGHAPAAPQPARRRRAPAAGQRRIANPRDTSNTDWAVLNILQAEGPLGVDRIVYHSGLLSKLDVLTSLQRLVAVGRVVRRGTTLFAAVS